MQRLGAQTMQLWRLQGPQSLGHVQNKILYYMYISVNDLYKESRKKSFFLVVQPLREGGGVLGPDY